MQPKTKTAVDLVKGDRFVAGLDAETFQVLWRERSLLWIQSEDSNKGYLVPVTDRLFDRFVYLGPKLPWWRRLVIAIARAIPEC